MALMTAAELRAAIPELGSNTDHDTELDRIIARMGGAFARYCGYPPATATASSTMESTTYTLYLTGSGGRDLVLPIRPVTAITSIEDDVERDFNGSTYLVASAGYSLRWDPSRGSVVVLTSTSAHGVWSTVRGAIKVVCTAGWTTAPYDVLEAARIAARQWWGRRSRDGMMSRSAGQGGSTTYRDEDWLTEEVTAMLGQYRLPGTVIGGGCG